VHAASNLEVLRERMGKAYSDPDTFFEIVHPDVEWDIRDSSSPMAGIYHGRDAVREFYRRWAGAFSDWSYELDEIFEAGEKVVAFVTERGHGRGSGAEVTMRRANVWTFRDGLVVRFQSFGDREAALAAAGLEGGA
jgi:ketosteroid isomerase-like protein